MKNEKLISQRGSMAMWVVVVGLVVLIGVGYFVFSSKINKPVPTNDNLTNNQNAASSASAVPSSATSNGNLSNPDESGNSSLSQNLDCNSYLTASDVINAIGSSDQTTVTGKASGNGGCVISWKDPWANPIAPTVPNSTGIINLGKTRSAQEAIIAIITLCKNKPSLNIGDVSCAGPMTNNPDGGIIFAKGGLTVAISKISLVDKAGGLEVIARTIASKM